MKWYFVCRIPIISNPAITRTCGELLWWQHWRRWCRKESSVTNVVSRQLFWYNWPESRLLVPRQRKCWMLRSVMSTGMYYHEFYTKEYTFILDECTMFLGTPHTIIHIFDSTHFTLGRSENQNSQKINTGCPIKSVT